MNNIIVYMPIKIHMQEMHIVICDWIANSSFAKHVY